MKDDRFNSNDKFTRRSSSSNGRNSASLSKKRPSAKRKVGIRIGNLVLRPRLIIVLLAIVLAVVGIVTSISFKEPDCYTLNYSSITMYEDVDGIILKDEHGFSYTEGVTVVSRIPDGTYVEVNDVIAVVRTPNFNDDWYPQLEIARRATIEYMLDNLSVANSNLQATLDSYDQQINELSEKMLTELAYAPQKYREYSAQLKELYIEKRNAAVRIFGTDSDQRLDDLLNKEDNIQHKIDECTQEITALKEGIISYNTDGYGNVYNYNAIDDFSAELYDNVLNDEPTLSVQNARKEHDYYISNMSKIYIAMKGTGNTFRYLSDNDDAIINIGADVNSNMATVRRVEHNADSSYIVVEPLGTYNDIYRDRILNITVRKTWSGLVIPKEHIVKKKDVTGVYVYADEKKVFCEIRILAENDTVVILDTSSIDNIFKQGMQIVKQ